MRAFRLACLRYKSSEQEWQPSSEPFCLNHARNPIPYNAAISCFLDAAAQAFHSTENRCTVEKIETTARYDAQGGETTRSLAMTLQGAWLKIADGASSGVKALRDLLNLHILTHTRDWRLDESHEGNFRKPFFDLASRVLAVHDIWTPVPVERLFESGDGEIIHEVFALANEKCLVRLLTRQKLDADSPTARLQIVWDTTEETFNPNGTDKLSIPLSE